MKQVNIPKLGFGTWGFSGDSYGKIDKKKSIKLLEYAYKNNIKFIDTAASYGNGKVEKIIGEFLLKKKINRSKLIISSKGGLYIIKKNIKEGQNFSPKFIEKSINQSLFRLKTDYLDIFFLHSPKKKFYDYKKTFKKLKELKKKGIIKNYGVSPSTPEDALYFIKNYKIDYIQTNFNLLDQRIIDNGLMKLAKIKKIKIIARTPLVFGFLSNKINIKKLKKDKNDHRSFWSIEQLKKWKNSNVLFNKIRGRNSFALLALNYCLSYPQIRYAIPGMMKIKEINENLKVLKMKRLNNSTKFKIRNIYKQNEFIIKKRKSIY